MDSGKRFWIAIGALAAIVLAASLPVAVAHRTRIASKVTLKGNPQFNGRVTSGSPRCERSRKVKILAEEAGPDDLLTTVTTNRRGRWNAPVGSETGNFYARITRKDVGPGRHAHICKGDRSPSVRALPPYDGPEPGTPVGSGGALFADDGANDVTFISSGNCADLVKAGWSLVDCAQVTMAGGEVIWVVENKATLFGEAWAVRLYLPSAGSGEWATELQVLDESGGVFDAMNVVTTDLDGTQGPELVAGFRFAGTGQFLAYDVVRFPAGGPLAVAAHRGDLESGSAVLAAGKISDYEPMPGGFFRKVTIGFVGGGFQVVQGATVQSAPASQLG